MREGDGGVDSPRYQRLLLGCWVALVYGGRGAEKANLVYVDPRLCLWVTLLVEWCRWSL